jgi:23S rRNA pseudouridine2605 synthase
MVDSERGVGRADRALELGRSVERSSLPASVQAALAIAMSGARLDLGQPELALSELEVPQLDPDRAFSYSPALFAAYAEVLEELGRADDAARWRGLAERAEAALEGAQPDFVEVFELEEDDASDQPIESEEAESVATEPAPPAVDAVDAGDDVTDVVLDDAEGDPADAIEPEVAAILEETANLDEDHEATADADGDAERG